MELYNQEVCNLILYGFLQDVYVVFGKVLGLQVMVYVYNYVQLYGYIVNQLFDQWFCFLDYFFYDNNDEVNLI